MVQAAQGNIEPEFARKYSFPFDGFQLDAMACVRDGSSVMVSAPTSAGKTVVADYALWRTVKAGRRAIYTTPIKALSNQKRRELESLFPGRVGLLTGDRSENRDADIIVMTTEVLRNMLLDSSTDMDGIGCVVFDEVHYLADRDRGTIWEESIITCRPQIQLVCLSATIANAEEIAAWISQTHRPIALIRHDDRPIPLEHYAFRANALVLIRDATGRRLGSVNTPSQAARGRRDRAAIAQRGDVVRALRRANLLPAIWFAFTRRGVEADAHLCAEALPETTGNRRDAIESGIAWMLASIPEADRSLDGISRLTALLRRGVGFHHAGILPPCKALVEDLFSRGLLSVVCATDTLSVGINMPARTVVVSSMSRPVGGLLKSNDFSQLTGRAGRRGIDDRGAVVLLPDPYHDFERAYAIINGPLEPIRSTFTLRYSTLLTMFDGEHAEERLATLVRSSLRQFQLYGAARDQESGLAAIEAELLTLPRIPALDGREEELDQYLEIQRNLTAYERGERGGGSKRNAPARKKRGSRRDTADRCLAGNSGLKALLRSHPMHSLASEPGFQLSAAQRISLLRRQNRLVRSIESARRERDREAHQTARAVSAVLRRLGYVDRHGLRHKAAGLREMVAPAGIVISETYHEGLLNGLSARDLAEFMSWFACDIDRRRYNTFRLPDHLNDIRLAAETVFRRVSLLEERQGIRLAQGPSNWFWGVALAWCQSRSIEQISPRVEIAEGDIVSILNKTIDLLDQFKAMLICYQDDSMLATVSEARKLLCRGMVATLRTDGVNVVDEVPVSV